MTCTSEPLHLCTVPPGTESVAERQCQFHCRAKEDREGATEGLFQDAAAASLSHYETRSLLVEDKLSSIWSSLINTRHASLQPQSHSISAQGVVMVCHL